jgi:hypothetical protein
VGLHPVHAGPLPAETLVLHVALKSGAVWEVPCSAVLDAEAAYYEECGWYEDDADAMWRGGLGPGTPRPSGAELRGLIEANSDWVESARETHWRRLRPHAKHLSGPREEPPEDLLWAVEEQGGALEVYCTLTPARQYAKGYGWRDRP